MTKEQAEAYLQRNPKIEARLNTWTKEMMDKRETFFWFGGASNEADARVNLVEVWKAIQA